MYGPHTTVAFAALRSLPSVALSSVKVIVKNIAKFIMQAILYETGELSRLENGNFMVESEVLGRRSFDFISAAGRFISPAHNAHHLVLLNEGFQKRNAELRGAEEKDFHFLSLIIDGLGFRA